MTNSKIDQHIFDEITNLNKVDKILVEADNKIHKEYNMGDDNFYYLVLNPDLLKSKKFFLS